MYYSFKQSLYSGFITNCSLDALTPVHSLSVIRSSQIASVLSLTRLSVRQTQLECASPGCLASYLSIETDDVWANGQTEDRWTSKEGKN